MTRLTLLLFMIVSSTFMGMGMIAALTMGYGTLAPLLIAIAIGFVLAAPASWLIARRLSDL